MTKLFDLGKQIVQRLEDAGHIAYFAGGWVRDYLLSLPSDDIDIATTASPEQVQALFPKTVPVGSNFGVVMVIEENVPFEVASFRADGLYVDGRHPEEVRYSTPEEDAQRRDFTINGMFYDPLRDIVHDYVGGQEDLAKQLVRAIGEPAERFHEDRLRMIRAVRLVGRFGFTLDPATESAIMDYADQLFPSVAVERVWQEFVKMRGYAGFPAALRELHRLKLLSVIFPELHGLSEAEIARRTEGMDDYLDDTPTVVYISTLLGQMPLQDKLAICHHFKLSKAEQSWVEYLTAGEMLGDDAQAWVHWYADHRSQAALQVIAPQQLRWHGERQKQWAAAIARVREHEPLIGGTDLRAAGIEPGPQLGELLREAERLSIVEGIHDSATLMQRLQGTALWQESSNA